MKILCSVFDTKAELWMDPFCTRSRGEAIRMFIDSVGNPSNATLNQHPEDFGLYYLGEFDEGNAVITLEPQPISLITGDAAAVMLRRENAAPLKEVS